MTADYEQAVREHLIDLAYDGDTLIGLVEMIPSADYLLIENVAVAPAAQGQGLGSALLARAERQAAAVGLAEMRLYTNPRFGDNVALYERRGYGIDRTEPYKDGHTVYMSKQLTA